MKRCIIDYETYYGGELSVKTLGNANYIKRADAYIGAILLDGQVTCGTISELREMSENIAKDPEIECWAANANFDHGWWDKYNTPCVNDWQCLLDLGRFHQLPDSLATLSKCVLGTPVDKTIRDEMKGVDYFTLAPERQTEIQQYCMGDVIHANNLLDKLPPMSPMEHDVAMMTRAQNRFGVFIDRPLVEKDKTTLSAMRHQAFLNIPWRNDYAPLSYNGLKAYCLAENIPVPLSTSKKDEECEDLQSEHPKLRAVIQAMQILRSTNTRLKKAEALLTRMTDDDILPMDLIYCGAPHTRRWSCRGFNVQNLEKVPYVYGDLSIWQRPWIRARPGKIFLILDYAAIEPCCINWLAGNDEFLALVAKGMDPYEAYARSSMGWKGGVLKKERGDLRAIYKIHVLSGGFAGGEGAFTRGILDAVALAKKGMEGASEEKKAAIQVEIDALTNAMAPGKLKQVIQSYRSANPKIVKLWAQMEGHIKRAALDKDDHTLRIQMPSGDYLTHWHVRQKISTDAHGRKSARYTSTDTKGKFIGNSIIPNLWKGLLAENITQRLARDVMAAAAVRLWKAGVRVLWTSHDEAIIEMDDDASKEANRIEIEHLMSTVPDWVAGLPLKAEGEFCHHYTKLK